MKRQFRDRMRRLEQEQIDRMQALEGPYPAHTKKPLDYAAVNALLDEMLRLGKPRRDGTITTRDSRETPEDADRPEDDQRQGAPIGCVNAIICDISRVGGSMSR